MNDVKMDVHLEMRSGPSGGKLFSGIREIAGRYFGQLESRDGGHLIGWAWYPRRPGYPPLIHALDGARVVATALVVAPAHPTSILDGKAYRFDLDVSHLASEDCEHLVVVIAETDQELEASEGATNSFVAPAQFDRVTIDDLMSIRSRKSWASGVTYHDALDAGVAISEILHLFYKDYLGREADSQGLNLYMAEMLSGRATFDSIRRSLVESAEYKNRLGTAGWAPGAAFSDAILYGPVHPLPGGKSARRLRRVSVKDLAPLWGESLLRAAFTKICRAPLANEVRDRLVAAFGDQIKSKRDLASAIAAIANATSDVVEIVDDESLGRWPISLENQIPLSELIAQRDDAKFVETAYAMICCRRPAAPTLEAEVIGLRDGARSRADVLSAFLAEAREVHKIPSGIILDDPAALGIFGGSTRDKLSVALDNRIVGAGWHHAEMTDAVHFRWMPRSASLAVPFVTSGGGDFILEVDGHDRIALPILESFVCHLNGAAIEGSITTLSGGKWSYVSKPFSGALLRKVFPSTLTFETTDAEAYQHKHDARHLTVAISNVVIRMVRPESA